MFSLENRVAIITGGGAGIGFGYAKVFAKQGAKVALFEYSEEAGTKAEKELRDAGFDATFYKVDVSKEDVVNDAVAKVMDDYGRIDILVNNAQATDRNSMPAPIDQTTTSLMRVTWETGALGTFFCARAVVPHMKKAGFGRIINTGSNSGLAGLETFTAYGSQKEAIRSMTKIWAHELAHDGITVNVILPGALTAASKLWMETDPEGYAEAMKDNPMGRLGDPEEDIAPLVVFLASEESRYVSGQAIGVDGGSTRF